MSPHTTTSLEDRLRALADELCTALEQTLAEALHSAEAGSIRPVQLTHELGLNKSLASRVIRALHEEDSLRALRGIPTPQGLQLIHHAARKAQASDAVLERLNRATEAYAELLSEFSGGRTDLEATLAGWLPEERERAERDARRSVFRGMTTLCGTRAGTVYNSIYLLPSSEDPERLDSLLVAIRQDVRRLRVGAPLLVMSFGPFRDDEDWRSKRRTLGGREVQEDPLSFLLPDLCSHPIPKLEVTRSRCDATEIRIAEDSLDVNEFATLGLGCRTLGHFERFATPESRYGCMPVRAGRPAEALTFDLFIHRDIVIEGDPIATVSLDHPLPRRLDAEPPAEGSPDRTTAPAVIHLDAHPSGLSSQDVRSCKAIAENATREAGLQPSDFRKFRTRIEFPIQSEELTLWWRLPERA
ncbi:hypothetical protein Poly30_32360 [Planctomycetes bacterium Poly30]|uniref:Uncharacterized protein n=1 Tax=Saltatorellus ferox TaxID=2528018 RepID=A0A518EUD8_9BACT|nr:hypothetical protein Poly30_32360 [Planctomycetes bacterium Poly30]